MCKKCKERELGVNDLTPENYKAESVGASNANLQDEICPECGNTRQIMREGNLYPSPCPKCSLPIPCQGKKPLIEPQEAVEAIKELLERAFGEGIARMRPSPEGTVFGALDFDLQARSLLQTLQDKHGFINANIPETREWIEKIVKSWGWKSRKQLKAEGWVQIREGIFRADYILTIDELELTSNSQLISHKEGFQTE